MTKPQNIYTRISFQPTFRLMFSAIGLVSMLVLSACVSETASSNKKTGSTASNGKRIGSEIYFYKLSPFKSNKNSAAVFEIEATAIKEVGIISIRYIDEAKRISADGAVEVHKAAALDYSQLRICPSWNQASKAQLKPGKKVGFAKKKKFWSFVIECVE